MLNQCYGVCFWVFFLQPAWSNSHYFLLHLIPCYQQVSFVHRTPANLFPSRQFIFPLDSCRTKETAWGLWAIVYQPTLCLFLPSHNHFCKAWTKFLWSLGKSPKWGNNMMFVFAPWFPLLPLTQIWALCQKCICISILCTTVRSYKQSLRGAEKDHIKVLTWLITDCIW